MMFARCASTALTLTPRVVAVCLLEYTVLEARDGDEALAVARRHSGVIALVITDIVMPGLGGWALTARLAAERPAIRVMYTTGYARHAAVRDDEGRSVPFLAKPCVPRDLIRKVRDTLDMN